MIVTAQIIISRKFRITHRMYRAGTATIVSWFRVKNALRIYPTRLLNSRPPSLKHRYTRFIRALKRFGLDHYHLRNCIQISTRTLMQSQCCGDDGLFKTAAGLCNLSPTESGYCHAGCKIICVCRCHGLCE